MWDWFQAPALRISVCPCVDKDESKTQDFAADANLEPGLDALVASM
jgi:hypothetical protein